MSVYFFLFQSIHACVKVLASCTCIVRTLSIHTLCTFHRHVASPMMSYASAEGCIRSTLRTQSAFGNKSVQDGILHPSFNQDWFFLIFPVHMVCERGPWFKCPLCLLCFNRHINNGLNRPLCVLSWWSPCVETYSFLCGRNQPLETVVNVSLSNACVCMFASIRILLLLSVFVYSWKTNLLVYKPCTSGMCCGPRGYTKAVTTGLLMYVPHVYISQINVE